MLPRKQTQVERAQKPLCASAAERRRTHLSQQPPQQLTPAQALRGRHGGLYSTWQKQPVSVGMKFSSGLQSWTKTSQVATNEHPWVPVHMAESSRLCQNLHADLHGSNWVPWTANSTGPSTGTQCADRNTLWSHSQDKRLLSALRKRPASRCCLPDRQGPGTRPRAAPWQEGVSGGKQHAGLV